MRGQPGTDPRPPERVSARCETLHCIVVGRWRMGSLGARELGHRCKHCKQTGVYATRAGARWDDELLSQQ